MKKSFIGTTLLVLLATLAACNNTSTPTVTPSTDAPTSTPTTAPTSAPTSTPTTAPTTAKPTSTPTSTPTTAKPTSTPTTAKPTTQTPTTQTPTTVPPTTVPPTTVPPTTVPPTSVAPVENAITGRIVDQNGTAVKDVKVYLNYLTIQVALQTSAEDGTFAFTNVDAATYNIILVPPTDAYEYKGEKITFEYTSGAYSLNDIVLTKSDMNWGALS